MSDKNARTLSHQSNRVKPRDTQDKKVAFKGVLDNPFRIQWPSVPLTLQQSVLECVIDLLESASDYRQHRCVASKKRKRVAKPSETLSRKNRSSKSLNDVSKSTDPPAAESPAHGQDAAMNVDQDVPQWENHEDDVEPPVFLRHLIYGINAVTKRLEAQSSRPAHLNVLTLPETSMIPPKPLKYIFVCRADVDPPLLIEHLPHLVAAYNSARPSQYAKLVPLPQGSEFILAQILGIRRVTVLGIDADFVDDLKLKSIVEPIPILAASWLSQCTPISPLIQTHIKLLRTTTPKDMKRAKELRLRGRAAARQKRLEQE